MKLEILKADPQKLPSGDNIGAKIIKLCPDKFSDTLAKYSSSITKGEYPKQLKIAKVIALLKSGEISSSRLFSKIFEKLLCKQPLFFVDRNNISNNFQFVVMKLCSTTIVLRQFQTISTAF